MGQIDSTAVDTVAYGVSNVARYNGWNISFSGLAVVFGGLVLIALTIFLFNKLSAQADKITQKKKEALPQTELGLGAQTAEEEIPEDHIVAIGVAVELYRRLHLETLQSTITFTRGEVNSNWKAGVRFGQRKS